jgi:hypothetical protein
MLAAYQSCPQAPKVLCSCAEIFMRNEDDFYLHLVVVFAEMVDSLMLLLPPRTIVSDKLKRL